MIAKVDLENPVWGNPRFSRTPSNKGNEAIIEPFTRIAHKLAVWCHLALHSAQVGDDVVIDVIESTHQWTIDLDQPKHIGSGIKNE